MFNLIIHWRGKSKDIAEDVGSINRNTPLFLDENTSDILIRTATTQLIQPSVVFSQVEVFSKKHSRLGWRPISQRFLQEHYPAYLDAAKLYVKRIFQHEDGAIDLRLLRFVESLERHCQEERVMWFFWYVMGMLDYFFGCHVENQHKIEIYVGCLMDDLGDELFDVFYSVEKEMGILDKDKACLHFGKGGGEMQFRKRVSHAALHNRYEKGYEHIGANSDSPLDVRWVVDLDLIEARGK